MNLWELVLVCCLAMVAKDAIGTFLTIYETRGRAAMSGLLNAAGTPAGIIFYSYGATGLTHGHGLVGWLGLIPIMCIDMFDGWLFTRLGRRIKENKT